MIFFGMNALVLFASFDIDPQLCGRLCLMLAHSVWQLGLLALIATLFVRFQKRENPELGYAVYVAALLVGLAVLPITYSLVQIDPQVVEVTRASATEIPTIMPNVQPQVEQTAQLTAPIAVERSESQPSAVPVATSQESQAESSLLRFAPWLAGCYAVGVIVMLLRLGQGIWKSYKLARDAKPVGDGSLNQAFLKIARAWSLRVLPVLAQAQEIIVPQVVGLLRPTILLPTSALSGLSTDELEMILAHELAHVRRYDMWVNLLQRLAESILFFNPALWYLSRCVSTYREYCCDEQTCRSEANSTEAVRLRYAKALLHVVELSGKGTSPEIAALAATGAGPSELRRRVARLFGEPLREPVRVSRTGLVSLLLGVALLFVGPISWQTAARTTEGTSIPEEKAKTKSETGNARFSFGSKVEVRAIGTNDDRPQVWWDANGKRMGNPPIEWKGPDPKWKEGRSQRKLIFRIHDLPADVHVVWNTRSDFTPDMTTQYVGGSGARSVYQRAIDLEDGATDFALHVGVARGEWQTVASTQATIDPLVPPPIVKNPNALLTGVFLNGSDSAAILSHSITGKALRVVAIDKQGTIHESGEFSMTGVGALNQSTWKFRNLTQNQIDHFEFQTRDYEWTEIKDLPVEPGEKSADDRATRSRLLEELDQLTKEHDSGVVAVPRKDLGGRFAWLGATGGDAHFYQITSKKKFWRNMERRFDSIAEYEDALADVLEGMERDPYGPQVDLKELYNSALGDWFFLQGGKELLFGCELTTPQKVEAALEKIATAEPDTQMTHIGDIAVWKLPKSDGTVGATCIWQNCMIHATHIASLEQLLGTASSDNREMHIRVVDNEGNPILGAKIFRNLTFKNLVDGKTRIENENYFSNEDGDTVVALASEPRSLRIWATKPGYVPMHASWTGEQQKNGDKIPQEFEFRMKRGTKISGIVTNVAGIPIPGVKVEVTENTHNTSADDSELPRPVKRPVRTHWLAYGAAGVMTDAQGRWTIENIPSDDELNSVKYDSPNKAPLLLRFSHPEYETIEGIEDYQTIWNPSLEQLRDGTARTVLNWVDKDDLSRENAIRLEQGKTYANADFHGRHFAGQDLMVWSDNMLNRANLSDSVWEEMVIPAMDRSFQETNFTRARLMRVQLPGGSGGFQKALFDGASLESANLTGSVSAFQQTRFDNALITNSNLNGGASAFQVASFQGTRIQSSKLTGSGPAFQKSNFNDAKLVKTAIVCNSPTAFQGVSLNNAEFVEADLSSIDAQALASCEFDEATPPRYDEKTKFPEGFDPEGQGWKFIQ